MAVVVSRIFHVFRPISGRLVQVLPDIRFQLRIDV